MNKARQKRNFKTPIFIALLFFIFFSSISFLRNKYGSHRHQKAEDTSKRVHFSANKKDSVINPLPILWKYKNGDNKFWASINYNDTDWIKVHPLLDFKEANENAFKGICWFRCYFKTDSTLINKISALELEHLGASEIYLDGKLIGAFGKVSSSLLYEKPKRPSKVLLITIPDNKPHLIAIRYSNHSFLSNHAKFNTNQVGINISFIPNGADALESINLYDNTLIGFIILFGFFITLSFVHLLIYLFYRKQVQNLYYSLFVFMYSLLALSPYLFSKITIPFIYLTMQQYVIVIFVLFFISLVACLHSLFKPKFWKRFFAGFVVLGLFLIFNSYLKLVELIEGSLIFALILFAIIESVRSVISGIRKNYQGAGIIGAGVLTFFIFISVLTIDVVIYQTLTFEAITFYVIFLVFIAIISIPLSMSIYLARNFALTNIHLEEKLIEVHNLSAKSIAQEKEKQLLLENQNTTLEKQVSERTFEIREQKKLIEEKNKDIIDSINYARRIQAAMLPDEKQFKKIFADSFILYQPRDIVSGDFYYAAELGKNKLIIAADCTGHGVPGALMSMVGCNIINKLTHENKISDPKTILETLHIELRHALKQNLQDSMNRDGMDVAVVLMTNEEIIYAAANRPLIYFDKENLLHELKPTKTPIGGSHNQTVSIEQCRILKSQVSQFFLFSDGFADQFGGPQGKKLMVSKFKLWLVQISTLNTENQFQFLTKNFQEWKQNSEQVDDVMVIGIKI